MAQNREKERKYNYLMSKALMEITRKYSSLKDIPDSELHPFIYKRNSDGVQIRIPKPIDIEQALEILERGGPISSIQTVTEELVVKKPHSESDPFQRAIENENLDKIYLELREEKEKIREEKENLDKIYLELREKFGVNIAEYIIKLSEEKAENEYEEQDDFAGAAYKTTSKFQLESLSETMESIRKLWSDVAPKYSRELAEILYEPSIVTNQFVADFIRNLGDGAIYLVKAGKESDITHLLDSRIMCKEVAQFANRLGEKAEGFFLILASSPNKNIDALLDPRIVNNNVAELVKTFLLDDSSVHTYFRCVLDARKEGALEELTNRRTFEAISKLGSSEYQSRFFEVACELDGKGIVKLNHLCEKANPSVFRNGKEVIVGILEILEIPRFRNINIDKDMLDRMAIYVLSGKAIPIEDIDTDDFLKRFEPYLYEKYGLVKTLNLAQTRMLLGLSEDEKTGIISIVNQSNEMDRKEYDLTNASENSLRKYSSRQRVEYVIQVLLGEATTKSKAKTVLSELVGDAVINKALNEFNANKWRSIKENALDMKTTEAYLYIKSKFARNEVMRALLDVVEMCSVPVREGAFSSVISNNPLDFDSRVLGACIFLPNGVDGVRSIISYTTHPNALLVRYDNNGDTVGTAVCLKINKTLFVNSIEGASSIRNDFVFSLVLEDMITRAKENGFEKLAFLADPGNKTPKDFIKYLEGKGIKASTIKFSKGDFEGHMDVSSADSEVGVLVLDIEQY